jgi:hypothetical protein
MVVKSVRVNYSRSATTDAVASASFTGVRNAIRLALHPTGQFIVSDIAQWNQINTYKVWAFVVRHISSGQEWLIGGGHRTGSTAGNITLISLILNIFSTASNTTLFSTENIDAWFFFTHYNEKGPTQTYNFGFTGPDLTYTTGDYTVPAVNINTEDFWPDTAANMYRGTMRELGSILTTTGRGYTILFNFETEAPLLTFQFQGAQQHIPSSFMAYGKIMNPSTTGDTDRTGVFGCAYGYSEAITTGYFGRILTPWSYFKDDTGAIVSNGTFTIQGVYNFNNELDVNGNFKRRSINVQSAGYTKGILDPNYFFEVAAFEDFSRDGLRLTGPVCSLCKVNGAFCVPLETTMPYPVNLQDGITLFS